MLIDWFTVLAQVVNFLVLILILRRFLYGPILRAVQERERRIAALMEDAEQAKQEALTRTQELNREKKAMSKAREQYQAETKQEVQQWREKALEQARQEIESSRQAWLDNMEGEKEAFFQKLKIRVAEQVLHIARKVLQDMGSGHLEAQLVETFLREVETSRSEWKGEEPQRPYPVQIRTGFELSNNLQGRLIRVLKKFLPAQERVDFTVEPALGFGIQLLAADQKVEWNLMQYMRSLEAEVLTSLTPVTRRIA